MRKPIAILVAAALAAVPGLAAAETIKVAIPQRGAWASSFTELGVGQGFFKTEGLDLELTATQGGATTEQALIAGSVDIAVATGLLGMIATYVKGAPVRVVSAEATGAPDIFWYVKADSPIKGFKDLHGKSISFSAPGSSSNLVLMTLLKEDGIADAKLVPIGAAPNGLPQVMTGQLDASWSTPPTGLREIQDKQIRIIARGNDSAIVRNETVRVNAVNLNYFQGHRDAVTRFIKAYKESVDWAYADPAALAAFAKLSGLPLPVVTTMVKEFENKDTEQVFEIRSTQRVLDEALAAKRIPHAMTPKDIAGLFDFVIGGKVLP